MTTKKLKKNVSTPNYISAFPLQDQIVFLDSFMELHLLVPSTLPTILKTIPLVHYIQALYIGFQKSHGVTNKISVIMNLGMKHVG